MKYYLYKNSLIFGDDNYHSVNKLTDLSLIQLVVGVSFAIPSGSTIKFPYLWRYGFTSVTSDRTRFYGTSTGAINSVPSDVNTSTTYNVGSSIISEAYVSTSNTESTSVSTFRMYSSTDWCVSAVDSVPSDSNYRAIIIRFSDNRVYDFPTNFYYIDEHNIVTWNENHYLYPICKNKTIFLTE